MKVLGKVRYRGSVVSSITNLGHHASPGDDVRLAFLAGFLFQSKDCIQKGIEMLICGIIQLLEGIKAAV